MQSFPELIGEFSKASSYYISTKMDGTSVTMYWKESRFGVCGRNYEYADDGKCAFWEYAKAHQIEEKLRANSVQDIAIQGEFCGGGIQKNRLKLKQPEWYVFTIIDMDTHRRMGLEEMEKNTKEVRAMVMDSYQDMLEGKGRVISTFRQL